MDWRFYELLPPHFQKAARPRSSYEKSSTCSFLGRSQLFCEAYWVLKNSTNFLSLVEVNSIELGMKHLSLLSGFSSFTWRIFCSIQYQVILHLIGFMSKDLNMVSIQYIGIIKKFMEEREQVLMMNLWPSFLDSYSYWGRIERECVFVCVIYFFHWRE